MGTLYVMGMCDGHTVQYVVGTCDGHTVCGGHV